MTTATVTRQVTGPDGEDVEVELELEVDEGEVPRISLAVLSWGEDTVASTLSYQGHLLGGPWFNSTCGTLATRR